MSERPRIDALLAQFAAHLDGGAPRPRVKDDDAIAITRAMHAEIDKGVAVRAAQSAAQGHPVACAKGCTSCCEQIVVTFEAEAVTIARWLAAPAHKAERARFAMRYPQWQAEGQDLIDATRAAAAREDMDAIGAAARASFARHLLCPFNHDGACDVYEVRPGVCREKEALDSAEPCKTGGTATVADFVPLANLMQRLNLLEGAMHAALPGAPPVRVPLADRVRELLRRGAAGAR